MLSKTDIDGLFTSLPTEICNCIYQFYKPKYLTEISKKIINLKHIYPLEHIEVLREYRDFRLFIWSSSNLAVYNLMFKKYKHNKKQQQILRIHTNKIIENLKNSNNYDWFRLYCNCRRIKLSGYTSNLDGYKDFLLYYLWSNKKIIKPRMKMKDIIFKCMRI